MGDLENIQETDTPPQSPIDSHVTAGDTVTIDVTHSTKSSVQYSSRAKAGAQTTGGESSGEWVIETREPVKRGQRIPRRMCEYAYTTDDDKASDDRSGTDKDETLLIVMDSPLEEGQGKGRAKGHQIED